jgi:hypothetical protein
MTKDTPDDAQVFMVFAGYLDNYIMTGQLLPIYRDFAIWTILPGRENYNLSTGILQKPR